jgi:ketosteroid isomerase-like protein
MTARTDDAEANKELVRRHIDLSWNAADFDALDQVWASDAVIHLYDGQTLLGLEALKEHLRSVVLIFDDRRCEIEALLSQGDTVANRWTFQATAGGEYVTTCGMDFYRMSDGLIVEEWIALGTPDSAT